MDRGMFGRPIFWVEGLQVGCPSFFLMLSPKQSSSSPLNDFLPPPIASTVRCKLDALFLMGLLPPHATSTTHSDTFCTRPRRIFFLLVLHPSDMVMPSALSPKGPSSSPHCIQWMRYKLPLFDFAVVALRFIFQTPSESSIEHQESPNLFVMLSP